MYAPSRICFCAPSACIFTPLTLCFPLSVFTNFLNLGVVEYNALSKSYSISSSVLWITKSSLRHEFAPTMLFNLDLRPFRAIVHLFVLDELGPSCESSSGVTRW
ncbi:hypothetical protein DFH06DRAFT_14348 [Mycena polygramma]|nr:hypothetical protein DFH06DRAFT_14348 [Mycena polygramma]